MPKFKIGDRVRVVRINGHSGGWADASCGKTGVVQEEDIYPVVDFDDGEKDWGSEEYLEFFVPSHIEINGSLYRRAEENVVPSHIEINGKRYRLVEEA